MSVQSGSLAAVGCVGVGVCEQSLIVSTHRRFVVHMFKLSVPSQDELWLLLAWLCRRRQEAQRMGRTPWPPDWGPGDASRFSEFPELPKSRTQLLAPEKGRSVQDVRDRRAVRQRSSAALQGPSQSANDDLSLQNVDDISSADLDAMVFRQRPFEAQVQKS